MRKFHINFHCFPGGHKGTVLANGCTFLAPIGSFGHCFPFTEAKSKHSIPLETGKCVIFCRKRKTALHLPPNFSQRDQFVSISKSGSKVNLFPPRIRMFVNTRMAVSKIKTISYRFVHPTPRRSPRLVLVAVCPH